MKNSNIIFLKLLVLVIIISTSVFLFQKNLIYSSLFMFFIFVLLLIELSFYIKNTFLFYDKTILAILQNDFSADFSKHKSFTQYKSLFLLYNQLKNNQNEQVSKDLIYRSLLNNIESGIVILQKEQEEWLVFFMNDYFSKHFKVPKVSKWNYLKDQIPSLTTLIENQNFSEIKTSLQIRVDQQDTQTFVMQTSKSKTFNQEYYVILMDSIQKVIDKKEKEAWVNLMKVISHELLNSLTPIRSLSQNMHELVQQETLSHEDLDDIKQSVSTMLNRSDHLQQFVESYRKLAMLPTPQKEKVDLISLLENSIQILAPILKKEQITLHNTISFNRWLMVDKNQMEQVFINLITNSIYALSDVSKKEIFIAAETKEKRVFITISDTGLGIDAAIEDKIFLPFFTTRKEGAGIGLTLSKNIIEAHGGYLAYQNKEKNTTFMICLIE